MCTPSGAIGDFMNEAPRRAARRFREIDGAQYRRTNHHDDLLSAVNASLTIPARDCRRDAIAGIQDSVFAGCHPGQTLDFERGCVIR
jgi:hypothetical protein